VNRDSPASKEQSKAKQRAPSQLALQARFLAMINAVAVFPPEP
jgi:hypothetical protein